MICQDEAQIRRNWPWEKIGAVAGLIALFGLWPIIAPFFDKADLQIQEKNFSQRKEDNVDEELSLSVKNQGKAEANIKSITFCSRANCIDLMKGDEIARHAFMETNGVDTTALTWAVPNQNETVAAGETFKLLWIQPTVLANSFPDKRLRVETLNELEHNFRNLRLAIDYNRFGRVKWPIP